MDVESQFWQLVDHAIDLDAEASVDVDGDVNAGFDSNRLLEPTFLSICQLVSGNPRDRSVFVCCFTELVLGKRQSPWMLVPFCMRALRMPEIEQALACEMDAIRGTARYASMMNYCSAVMHAFHDDVWEHAVAFEYFAHETD